MSLRKFLVIRSQDRDTTNSTSSTNFIIRLPESQNNVRKIKLSAVNCPAGVYNIRTGINDKINFNDNSTNRVATLNPGFYAIGDLMTEVARAMNAVSSGYTCTFSNSTGKITIANGSFSFTLLFSSGANAATSPWRELGFTNSAGTAAADSASAASATGASIANITGTYSLYLDILQLGATTITSTSGVNTTFTVPINVNSGEIINFASNMFYDQELLFPTGISLQKLDIRLKYPDGSTLSLNGADWEFILQLDF